MIIRELSGKLQDMAGKFPVLAVTGPRQSGKTTLCRMLFPEYRYVSLENPDARSFALTDPRGFLAQYDKHVILDEVQNVPALFSYLQEAVDSADIPGQYVLTGSQNFLLIGEISQSLAGRVYLAHLLPFSHHELQQKHAFDLNEAIFLGGYPRLHERSIHPNDFFPSYIQTYIERDVRSLLNIRELALFSSFLKLVAARTGQLFNATSLGIELGVDHKTVQHWISVLEASFVIYKLRPWHVNFNKRIVKSPKLYFYDTGLACHLLGIRNPGELQQHYARGPLFENYAVIECLKAKWHQGEPADFFFWRDNSGHEVDLLAERGRRLHVVEMKSAQTVSEQFFKGLNFMEKVAAGYDLDKTLLYAGDESRTQGSVNLVGWRDAWQAL